MRQSSGVSCGAAGCEAVHRRAAGPAAAQTVPEVTVTPGTTSVTEGTAATFTLSRTGATTEALAVTVSVSETYDMVTAANEGSKTVTFAVSAGSATLTVNTVADSRDEPDSVVTARLEVLAMNPPYTAGSPSDAQVTVQDDDVTGLVYAVGGG